jgi:hypothetical protein
VGLRGLYHATPQHFQMDESTFRFHIDPHEGLFHAMLSYRVNPDADLVTKIHDKLHLLSPPISVKGGPQENQLNDSPQFPKEFNRDVSTLKSSLNVFLDALCLRDGMPWEGDGGAKGGFIGAVRLSPLFVPLLSVQVGANGELVHRGSVGQMIDLARQDMQDNVLLEFIIARELYLLSKTSRFKSLSPCSFILPLFRDEQIWQAASRLPKTASAITNAKALEVVKQMNVPVSAISEDLKNGTLTVYAVWEFMTQFQGIKLYEHGKERFQVLEAAKTILGVAEVVNNEVTNLGFDNSTLNFAQINDRFHANSQLVHDVINSVKHDVADLKLDELNKNSSQMYELSDFMLKQNMSHYTAILARHRITNVFLLADLMHIKEDVVVKSIAEEGVRATEKSTLPVELLRIRSAIHAAQSSPFAKSLNDRFLNFIDRDASFVTMLSSSSLFDILLSKKFSVWLLFLFCAAWFIIAVVGSLQGGYFRFFIIPWIIFMLACLVSLSHSPRWGRYLLAIGFCCFAGEDIVRFSFSVNRFLNGDCAVDSAQCTQMYSELSNIQKIMMLPTGWFWYLCMAFCVLFRQQFTLPILFISNCIWLCIVCPIIGYSVVIRMWGPGFLLSPLSYLTAFLILKVLQYIGNKRAQLIYKRNSSYVEDAYKVLLNAKKENGSFFGKLLSTLPSEAHAPLFGIFSRCRPVSGFSTEVSLIEIDSSQDQHSASNSSRNHSSDEHASAVVLKTISISDMFKTERLLQGYLLQPHHSFENLIQDAEFINDAFQEWVSSWISDGPDFDDVQKYLYQPVQPEKNKTADQHNAEPKHSTTKRVDDSFLCLSCKTDFDKGTKSEIENRRKAEFRPKGTCIRGPLKHVDRAIAKVRVLL